MRHPNELLLEGFYKAFQHGDFRSMQRCYHPEATFSDPVFVDLSAEETKAMWEMLVTSGRDLEIEFRDVRANDKEGSVHWEARYNFSRTGRTVHNVIDAHLLFRDGLIWRHEDKFNFWKWSQQALGTSGYLLGWTPIVKNKVRTMARKGLQKHLSMNPRSG